MNKFKNQKGSLWIVILSFISIITICATFLLQKNSFLSCLIREKKEEFQCFNLLESAIQRSLTIIHEKVANNISPTGPYIYKIKDDYPNETSNLAKQVIDLEIIDERPNTNYCIVIASMRKPYKKTGSNQYIKYTKTSIVKKFVTYPLNYVLVTRNALLEVNSNGNLNITGHLHSDRVSNPSINLSSSGNMNITGNVEALNGISKSGTITIDGQELSPYPLIDQIVGPGVYPTTIDMPILESPSSPDYTPLVQLRDPILGRPDLTATNTLPIGFTGNPDPPSYSIVPADYLASAQYVFIRGGVIEPNPPIVAGPGNATWDNVNGILYLSGNINLPGNAIQSGIIYVEGDIVLGDGHNPPDTAINITGQGALIATASSETSPIRPGNIQTILSERGFIDFSFISPHSNFLNPAGNKTLSVGMLATNILFGDIIYIPVETKRPIYPTTDIMINAPFCSLNELVLVSIFNIAPHSLIINAELRSYATTIPNSPTPKGIIIYHYAGNIQNENIQNNANIYSQADVKIIAGTQVPTEINGNIAARNYINIHSVTSKLIINGDLWAGGWTGNVPYHGIEITSEAMTGQGLVLTGDLFAYAWDDVPNKKTHGGIRTGIYSGAEYSGKIYTPGSINLFNAEKNVNSGDVNLGYV
ncbi:MAG: hypothetical protein ABIB46_06820, partial [bacterium]